MQLIALLKRAGSQNETGRPLTQKIWLVMKMTIVLLTIGCLQLSAKGYTQSITLTVKNAPLAKVFKELKRQTGYDFWYETRLMKEAKSVTLDLKNAAIEQALDLCFKDQPLSYSIVEKTVVIKEKAVDSKKVSSVEEMIPPPPIDVHGRVVNEKGEPVEGATVAVKGTRNATATDADGYFVLKGVAEDAILLITAVNIENFQIEIKGKNDLGQLNAKTRIAAGDEIVMEANTGYQKVKPNEVTGSITVIDNKTINQQLGINIIDRLNGVTPGMLFEKKIDNPSGYTIRGLSTINGPKSPLIIVDNFPYEGSITNINPNSVETITILKDAAASSIWGTSAGNGVIVITTKRGRFSAPLRINFNNNIVVGTKPDLSKLAQMNSGDYIDVERYLFDRHYYDTYETNPLFPALSPAVEIFIKERDQLISHSEASAQIGILKSKDLRNELTKYMYRPSVNQQYSLDLNGGGANIAYLISGGIDKNVGSLFDKMERANLQVTNTYKPAKNLELNVSVFFTQLKSKSGKPGNVQMGGKPIPYLSLVDEHGNALSVAPTYRDNFTDTVGQGKLLNWKYYPLEDYKHSWTGAKNQNLTTNLGINYQALSWLSIGLNYQMQREVSEGSNYRDMESYETRDLVNTYTQLNYSTGLVKHNVPKGTILTLSHGIIEAHNARGQLNLNRRWGQHNLTMITGTEIRQVKSEGNAHTVFGYNDEFATVGVVDPVNQLPTFFGGSNYIGSFPSFYGKVNRFISLFINTAYTYKGKYILSGSARNDASNLFGVKTNDKWTPLWSTGLGWLISKENFYASSFLPYLKLRLTYGFSGNVDQSRAAVTTMRYYGAPDYQTGLQYGVIDQFYNPQLRWEKVRAINAGLDFASQNELISGSVEYYQKKGFDLFGPATINYTAGLGISSVIKNVADMKGNGIDVSLRLKTPDRIFRWESTILLSTNISKTAKYNVEAWGTSGTTISPLVGKPLYAIFSYRWAGLDPENGDPRGYLNKETSTDYRGIMRSALGADSMVYHGAATPVYFGSLGNTFQYKGFSLSFNVNFKMGYYFRKGTISYSNLVQSGIGHSDYARRWQNPGDEKQTTVPSFIYPINNDRDVFYALSEATVLKADHVRLQYINAGYQLKLVNNNKKAFSSLQLYVNASNIGLLWLANKEKLDPDAPYSAVSRSYAIGIRGNF